MGTLPLKKTEWRVFAQEVKREFTGQVTLVKPRLNKRVRQCIEQTVTRLVEKQGKEVNKLDIEQEKERDIQKVDINSIKSRSHHSLGKEHDCH